MCGGWAFLYGKTNGGFLNKVTIVLHPPYVVTIIIKNNIFELQSLVIYLENTVTMQLRLEEDMDSLNDDVQDDVDKVGGWGDDGY